MTDVVVLDVDGTLVDTNYHHALAWYRAFRRCDITVPVWRLHRAIGMGGDEIVGHVAGDEVEQRYGDQVRAAWAEEFQPMLAEVRPLAGARELLAAVRSSGRHLVLASSGKPEHVEAYLDLLDARRYAEGWTTAEDVEHSKPAPDLLVAALRKVAAERAVVVGDSVWDCVAARRLDLPPVALRTGGFSAEELRAAGADRVYEDLPALTGDLPELPVAPLPAALVNGSGRDQS
jgi:HAD superfamily hydrolase (TIGR01549 family)